MSGAPTAMNPLGLAHTLLAVAALVLGGVVVGLPKGGRRHRTLGLAYAIAMLLVNVTALMIYRLFGTFGPFHWAALISLATLAAGWIPVRRRGPGWLVRHAYFMAWSYVGLLAALAAEITSRVPGWDFGRSVMFSSLAVFVLGGIAIATWIGPMIRDARR